MKKKSFRKRIQGLRTEEQWLKMGWDSILLWLHNSCFFVFMLASCAFICCHWSGDTSPASWNSAYSCRWSLTEFHNKVCVCGPCVYLWQFTIHGTKWRRQIFKSRAYYSYSSNFLCLKPTDWERSGTASAGQLAHDAAPTRLDDEQCTIIRSSEFRISLKMLNEYQLTL
jgi:hypothetical protein